MNIGVLIHPVDLVIVVVIVGTIFFNDCCVQLGSHVCAGYEL